MGEGGKEAGMEGGKEHDREPFQRQFHKCRSQVQTPGDRLRFGPGAPSGQKARPALIWLRTHLFESQAAMLHGSLIHLDRNPVSQFRNATGRLDLGAGAGHPAHHTTGSGAGAGGGRRNGGKVRHRGGSWRRSGQTCVRSLWRYIATPSPRRHHSDHGCDRGGFAHPVRYIHPHQTRQ